MTNDSAQLRDQTQCIWPDCEHTKLPQTMICHQHLAEAATLVHQMTSTPTPEQLATQLKDAGRIAFTDEVMPPAQPKRPPRPARDGHIYIIEMDDLIKVGHSTDIYRRLREYPPNARVLTVFPGTTTDEKNLHGRFRFALSRGREWYRPAPEIKTYATAQTVKHGTPSVSLTDRQRDPRDQGTIRTRNTAPRHTAGH